MSLLYFSVTICAAYLVWNPGLGSFRDSIFRFTIFHAILKRIVRHSCVPHSESWELPVETLKGKQKKTQYNKTLVIIFSVKLLNIRVVNILTTSGLMYLLHIYIFLTKSEEVSATISVLIWHLGFTAETWLVCAVSIYICINFLFVALTL